VALRAISDHCQISHGACEQGSTLGTQIIQGGPEQPLKCFKTAFIFIQGVTISLARGWRAIFLVLGTEGS